VSCCRGDLVWSGHHSARLGLHRRVFYTASLSALHVERIWPPAAGLFLPSGCDRWTGAVDFLPDSRNGTTAITQEFARLVAGAGVDLGGRSVAVFLVLRVEASRVRLAGLSCVCCVRRR